MDKKTAGNKKKKKNMSLIEFCKRDQFIQFI